MLTGRRCGGTSRGPCRRAGSVPRWAARSRRSSAASSSSRSRTARAARRTRRRGCRGRCRARRGRRRTSSPARRAERPRRQPLASLKPQPFTRVANVSTLATNLSTSSSSCCTDSSHCSTFPHGGRKTPPLCWTSQCRWPEPLVDVGEVAEVAHRPVEEADAALGPGGHDLPREVVVAQHARSPARASGRGAARSGHRPRA